MTTKDRTVAVIGAGTMGRGIAQSAAVAGFDVLLVDVVPGAADAAIAAIGGQLDRLVEKGKLAADGRDAALSRLGAGASLDAALPGRDVVIEAIPESLELKRGLFAELDRRAPAGALLATNTSSLPVGELAAAVADATRVIGMHFFNPVPVMPLLEIVRAAGTGEIAVARARSFGAALGKECIVVKDSPGFATSRLGVALGLEAIRMLEEGVASAEDIDRAMTLGYRHPMGPLRLTDLVGLDVRLAIAEHLHRTLDAERFRPPELLRRLVAEGKLGRKTGEGFHRWDDV